MLGLLVVLYKDVVIIGCRVHSLNLRGRIETHLVGANHSKKLGTDVEGHLVTLSPPDFSYKPQTASRGRDKLNVSKLKATGWEAKIRLEEGLRMVYKGVKGEDWY